MNTEKKYNSKLPNLTKKILTKTKPKSLRPMRSLVAVRSMKSNITTTKFSRSESDSTLN